MSEPKRFTARQGKHQNKSPLEQHRERQAQREQAPKPKPIDWLKTKKHFNRKKRKKK